MTNCKRNSATSRNDPRGGPRAGPRSICCNFYELAPPNAPNATSTNEQAQRRSQREQDGSEVKLVQLERLLTEGAMLVERRNCVELFRDQTAERY